MKLYATTTSERASKGQGGNKFINIELSRGSVKDSVLTYQIHFQSDYIRLVDSRTGKILFAENTKGKSQKGEHTHNKDCYMQCMSKLV